MKDYEKLTIQEDLVDTYNCKTYRVYFKTNSSDLSNKKDLDHILKQANEIANDYKNLYGHSFQIDSLKADGMYGHRVNYANSSDWYTFYQSRYGQHLKK